MEFAFDPINRPWHLQISMGRACVMYVSTRRPLLGRTFARQRLGSPVSHCLHQSVSQSVSQSQYSCVFAASGSNTALQGCHKTHPMTEGKTRLRCDEEAGHKGLAS